MFAYIQYQLVAKVIGNVDEIVKNFLVAICVLTYIAMDIVYYLIFPEEDDEV